MTATTEADFSIFATAMTVDALRSNGYSSTTHAMLEIIDNGIEAGADEVEVVGLTCVNSETGRLNLERIAFLDNGSGMDAIELRRSLRYGDGTRRLRKSIGRFGVGLPASSLSQAKTLKVWSWQNGPANALRVHLDVNEVENGQLSIDAAIHDPVPDEYLHAAQMAFGDRGTLVEWTNLDRVEWRTANATFKNAEPLLGRVYRRFLSGTAAGDRETSITLVPVEMMDDGSFEVKTSSILSVRSNDPLYLLSDTSCPETFGPGPMFEEHPASPLTVELDVKGAKHPVTIRASSVRRHARRYDDELATWPEAEQGKDAGSTPWGKHAANNLGVSMIRADRELDLDDTWTNNYDPTERWWSIEIDFPQSLDEVFGVTNSKQGTTVFKRLSNFDWKKEADPGESEGDVLRRLRDSGDHRGPLLDLHRQVETFRKDLRDRVQKFKSKRGTGDGRHEGGEKDKAEQQATQAIKRRQEDGHVGTSDIAGENSTPEEQAEQQVGQLVQKHKIDPADAEEIVRETIEGGKRVRWIVDSVSSPAFFDVEQFPNLIQVVLNRDHPVMETLWGALHPGDDLDADQLRDQIGQASDAFRVLVYAWARYEDEQTGDRAKRTVTNSRWEWGKYITDMLDGPDPSDD